MQDNALKIRSEILKLTKEYVRLRHTSNLPADNPNHPDFDAATHSIPYSARVFEEEEVVAATESVLDFWLTLGSEGAALEVELANWLGAQSTLLTNSGSSANLIAVSALTSHKLPPEKRILPDDEVITVAAGFPTTVAPIIQCGARPVFIDNDPSTGNVLPELLERAFRAGKTKAVILAHTLGNPFDIAAVLSFCRSKQVWLIEDNCDALGSFYEMEETQVRRLDLEHLVKIADNRSNPRIGWVEVDGKTRRLRAPTGVWGDLSTQSFYPPHHITMGEGGAVNIVRHPPLRKYAESIRDWGRDCWCPSGKDDTCGKRFGWNLGELPAGYDHKYVYSHLGYNLKPLDIQAAIGRVQLRRLDAFGNARRRNWSTLRAGLADLSCCFEFTLPAHASGWDPLKGFSWDGSGCRADPSWFGFMLRVKPNSPFSSVDLGVHLNRNKIGTRMLFGGNLLRQPVFVQIRNERPDAIRVEGQLSGADALMHQALFLGTYPGLTEPMIDRIISVIRTFVKQKL